MNYIRIIQGAAIAGGLLVLAWQIKTGFDSLGPTAELATIGGMVLVMVSMAFTPKLITMAAQARVWSLVAILTLAFVAGLFHALPATIGRNAEIKETRALVAETKTTKAAEAENLVGEELQRARDRLTEAEGKREKLCRTDRYSDWCLEARRIEKEKAARVDVLLKDSVSLKENAADKAETTVDLSDSGNAALASVVSGVASTWVGQKIGLPEAKAADVRLASVLGLGIWYDLAIWGLLGFGTSSQIRRAFEVKPEPAPTAAEDAAVKLPAVDLTPPPGDKKPLLEAPEPANDEEGLDEDASFADLRDQVGRGNYIGVVGYSERWRITKGEASKRITGWEEAGLIMCEREGKYKLVVAVKPHLVKAA